MTIGVHQLMTYYQLKCHYDYFKESDYKQAWELFQAVLGGTNLILEFLEANVEL